MSLKLAQGWQVMLADLSLILFLTTAASLATQDAAGPPSGDPTAEAASSATTAPVGLFRAGGETALSEWLAMRATDPREVLTIEARYRPGSREAMLETAAALAAEAAAAGIEARIVLEPGPVDEALAVFAFTGGGAMARHLQSLSELSAE